MPIRMIWDAPDKRPEEPRPSFSLGKPSEPPSAFALEAAKATSRAGNAEALRGALGFRGAARRDRKTVETGLPVFRCFRHSSIGPYILETLRGRPHPRPRSQLEGGDSHGPARTSETEILRGGLSRLPRQGGLHRSWLGSCLASPGGRAHHLSRVPHPERCRKAPRGSYGLPASLAHFPVGSHQQSVPLGAQKNPMRW